MGDQSQSTGGNGMNSLTLFSHPLHESHTEAKKKSCIYIYTIYIYVCPGALAYEAEYGRWLEEHNRHINELRTAVNSHASDPDLRVIVDNVAAHFNDIFRLKGNAAKTDVFHILSGMWKTPAERCFLWIGGFRPSELLKVRYSTSCPDTLMS